jgi:hypothetical protein
MQSVSYLFLICGIILCALGVFLLKNPYPKYMPKLSYRLFMKDMSQEGSTIATKIYGAACAIVGICFLGYFLLTYSGVVTISG